MKKIFPYVILLLLLTTVALPIGGGSKIYISDISIVLVSVVYVIGLVKKKRTVTKQQKIIALLMGIMISYLLVASVYHTVQGGVNQENFLLIRNYYMSFFIFFYASERKITSTKIENTLLTFITASNGFQLIYLILHSTLRTSPLFYTVVLYNLVAQLLIGFLFTVWFENKSMLKRNIAVLNILLILLFVLLTGSRAGSAMVIALTGLYGIYMAMKNGKKGITKLLKSILVLVVLAGTMLTLMVATNNTKGLDAVSRSLGIKREGLSTLPSANNSTTNKTKQNNSLTADSVNNIRIDDGSRSDALRDFINEKSKNVIQENFFIGAGRILVTIYDTPKVKMRLQPHNFVLEALLGYGLIGTILFFISLLLPFVLREMKFKKNYNFIIVAITLVGFFAYAWTQPSLNRMLPLQIFFLIYLYYQKRERELIDYHKKRYAKNPKSRLSRKLREE